MKNAGTLKIFCYSEDFLIAGIVIPSFGCSSMCPHIWPQRRAMSSHIIGHGHPHLVNTSRSCPWSGSKLRLRSRPWSWPLRSNRYRLRENLLSGRLCLCPKDQPPLFHSKPMGVWQGEAMDSLKYHSGSPCPTFLSSAGGPPHKPPYGSFRGGLPAGRAASGHLLPLWTLHAIRPGANPFVYFEELHHG
jgi:hypothetical protein